MKLFYMPGACSLAAHILLKETGLSFELSRMNPKDTTYSGGDFRKINPKGDVPALQLDNDDVLTEVAVILQYIADQKSEVVLIPPPGNWERYRCQEWLNYIATEVHKGFAPLWHADTPEDYKTIALKNLTSKLDYVEKHLSQNEYLLGSRYTVADIYLFTVVNWSYYLKIELAPWPKIQEFHKKIRNRAATVAAFQAEGLK